MMLSVVESLGSTVIGWIAGMGRMLILLVTALLWAFIPPFRLRRLARQIHFMGWRSMLVVVLTGAFTGMVLGLQGYYTLSKFGATHLLGQGGGNRHHAYYRPDRCPFGDGAQPHQIPY